MLNTTSTAAHNMFTKRNGALFLWTDLPASPTPWVAAVQARFAGSVYKQQCGLAPYAGPDGSMPAVGFGLNEWDACSSAVYTFFRPTDWGSSRVAAGSGDFNTNYINCTQSDGTQYTWFKLERDASDEFSAYWNPSLSDTLPSTGWLHMSTFTYSSDAPDRIALYHKTGKATTSTCSFRSFSLTSLTPSPPPPPASPPPPSPPPPPVLVPVDGAAGRWWRRWR